MGTSIYLRSQWRKHWCTIYAMKVNCVYHRWRVSGIFSICCRQRYYSQFHARQVLQSTFKTPTCPSLLTPALSSESIEHGCTKNIQISESLLIFYECLLQACLLLQNLIVPQYWPEVVNVTCVVIPKSYCTCVHGMSRHWFAWYAKNMVRMSWSCVKSLFITLSTSQSSHRPFQKHFKHLERSTLATSTHVYQIISAFLTLQENVTFITQKVMAHKSLCEINCVLLFITVTFIVWYVTYKL